MNKLSKLVALATLGLVLGACSQDEPINRSGGNELAKAQRFELNSSLATLELQPLSSNTDKASAENLRATLNFNGEDAVATTMLNVADYGTATDKRNARWGVKFDGSKFYSADCADAVGTEPTDPSALTNNTVFFKKATDNTIADARLKMYCQSLVNLTNMTEGFMCLEGKAGTGNDVTKQYFKSDLGTNPNHRIEALTATGALQEGRHIPIMTDVVPINKLTKPAADTELVKFGPRGSLIGLCLSNKTKIDMTITAILVKKDNALDFSGYFDWSIVGKANFIPEYTTAEDGQTLLELPVYADKNATEVGYTLTAQNTVKPCFYVWGFQNTTKKGRALEVQLRYKKTASSPEETTRTFKIFAPNSKVENGVKMFDDGYAYNTVLTIDRSNMTGGSLGTDWNGSGDANLVTSETEVHSLNFETPLDYLAESVVNKTEDGFVQDYEVLNQEVGYFNFNEANELFNGSKEFLHDYYLPSNNQWRSIIPSTGLWMGGAYGKDEFVENEVQIGREPIKNYESERMNKMEDGAAVCYAIRFKGTGWVSAWRYSFVTQENGKFRIKIMCSPLHHKPSITLDEIASKEFFMANPSTVRTLSFYGAEEHRNADPTVITKDTSDAKRDVVKRRISNTGEIYSEAYDNISFDQNTYFNDKLPVQPFRLNNKEIVENHSPAVSLNFVTPLDYLGEYVINKDKNDFVKNVDIANENVGYFTYDEATALFAANKPFLNYYTLPTQAQWQSIFPEFPHMNFYKSEASGHQTETNVQIGSETTTANYETDWKRRVENGNGVHYAIRYQGTHWASAWRYSIETDAIGKHYLKIMCVPFRLYNSVAGRNLVTTMDEVAKRNFFIQKPATVRTLPFYGGAEYAADGTLKKDTSLPKRDVVKARLATSGKSIYVDVDNTWYEDGKNNDKYVIYPFIN